MVTAKDFDFHGRLEVAVNSILSPTEGGRRENQDNYLIIDAAGDAYSLREQRPQHQRLTDWPAGHCRLAILDGMGGHSFGREATEAAVAGLMQMPASAEIADISAYLDDLHLRLNREMSGEGAEPGCTLTLLELPPDAPALLYHVGDSRLYRIDSNAATPLTVDHVPITKFAMLGLVDQQEWHRQAHETSGFQISQAFVLGSSLAGRELMGESLNRELYPLDDANLPDFLRGLGDRRPLPLQTDCVYLLASDGLWHLSKPMDYIARWPQLLTAGESLEHGLTRLFDDLIRSTEAEPRLRGDNSTAIAFRLTG